MAKKTTKKTFKKVDKNIYLTEFLKKIRAGDPLDFEMGILRRGMISLHSKKNYRGNNLANLTIVTMARSARGIKTSPFWLTFSAIKREEGMLTKGSKGTRIWSPVFKKDDKDENKEKLAFFKCQTVFNLADTTGIDHPVIEKRKININKEIEDYIFVDVVNNLGGSYHYSDHFDHINMPPQADVDSDGRYYQSLLHELSHATGVKSRLNRDCFHRYHKSGTERAKEEFVAEFSSYLLAREFGIMTDDLETKTLAYLAGWGKNISDEEAITSLKQSFSAIETILSKKWFKEGKFEPVGKNFKMVAKASN